MRKIDFKKWAFHFMICIFILNIITYILTINYENFPGEENNTGTSLLYIGILATFLLVLCILLVFLSTIRKENRNYQYWFSIVGIVVFGILPLIVNS